jgi:hypothetical protein
VRANREYEVSVHRGGSILSRDRVDHIEVIEITSGEVVLFWDTLPSQTRKLARALKADLAQMEAEDFVARWERYEQAG